MEQDPDARPGDYLVGPGYPFTVTAGRGRGRRLFVAAGFFEDYVGSSAVGAGPRMLHIKHRHGRHDYVRQLPQQT